jgi:hypothetical protein
VHAHEEISVNIEKYLTKNKQKSKKFTLDKVPTLLKNVKYGRMLFLGKEFILKENL